MRVRTIKLLVLLGSAVALGIVAGVLIDVATFLVARYGPQADNWSYRGNGALAVPFGLGPAVVAGAWVALVTRNRGFARWKELGLAAGLVGTALLIGSVIPLVAFGAAGGMATSTALMFAILGWMVFAPVLAAFIRPRVLLRPKQETAGHIVAGIMFTVVSVVAFYASGQVLAPGS